MSRIRRHRLVALGMSSAHRSTRRVAGERCRDDGAPIASRGGTRLHRPLPQSYLQTHAPTHDAMALGMQSQHLSDAEWGWPAPEPSSLSWPADDGDAASAMGYAASVQQPATPATALVPAKPAASPAPPNPLAEDELDDDLAELRPARDAVINAPPAASPAPAERPAAPVAPPIEDTPPPPAEDRHAIFGQLARTMPHATSFQLGRFNVDHHLDMLEQGLGERGPAAMGASVPPPPASRELHELDLLSEITALSEAAGVRPIAAEDDGVFLRKVARAQSSLAELDASSRDAADEANAIFAADEEQDASDDHSDNNHSPFPEADNADEEEPAENDDG
jgi:hypothetical protein